jgi:hypothetical protein
VEVARISPDDDERVVARRLVAQHCLYGVDKNPFAVSTSRGSRSGWRPSRRSTPSPSSTTRCARGTRWWGNVTAQQIRWIAFEEPVKKHDTREGGLRQILSSGGVIYRATSRYPWPGLAALVTSIVHFTKGPWNGTVLLNGRSVARISAFLFADTSDDSAVRLKGNPYFSLGSKIYGQGFLFDDDDAKASSTSLKDDLLKRIPNVERRIRPYIGGEELNSEPTQHHHRWVIVLSDVETEEQLDKWPELRDIVRAKVKPERDLLGNNPNNIPLKRRWWAYQAHRPELYRALTEVSRTLANSQVSAFHAFAWQPTDRIFSHKLNVFPNDHDAFFAVLQSRTHELWARFFASTLEDRLNYSPSDCFETFPFPEGWETNAALDDTGRVYYEFRAQLMVANDQGLTTTYNRFHDPDEGNEGILYLRALHSAMDRAVLDAYGWSDLQPTCEFLLEYEAAEGDDGGGAEEEALALPLAGRDAR